MLEKLLLLANSDNFVFDNQMLVQAVHFGFRIGEISGDSGEGPWRGKRAIRPCGAASPRRF